MLWSLRPIPGRLYFGKSLQKAKFSPKPTIYGRWSTVQ